MVTIVGSRIAFGVSEKLRTLPIVGLPDDTIQVRRRLRAAKVARIFVRVPDGIRCFTLQRIDGALALLTEEAANRRS